MFSRLFECQTQLMCFQVKFVSKLCFQIDYELRLSVDRTPESVRRGHWVLRINT